MDTNATAESDYVNNRISSCRSMLFAAKGIGSKQVPVSTVTASKLYWSVCIPKLTYGFEIMDVKGACLENVSQFHHQAAKIVQGLPDQAVNIGSLATLGWQPIDLHIDMLRLMFLWRISLLPMTNIYKTVFVRRILSHIENCTNTACGPVKNILTVCIKHNLLHYVLSAMENGDYCSMKHWKKMVKNILHDCHLQRWNVTKPMFSSLSGFNQDIFCMSPWWNYVHVSPENIKQSRLIVQLLINRDRHVHNICQCCNSYVNISPHHILFECQSLNEPRQSLWLQFEMSGLPNLVESMANMDNYEKCYFILNGLNCSYIKEWHNMYINLANFVYYMYKTVRN